MAIDPSNFLLNTSPNPSSAVIGMNATLNLLFSNTSATERGYNLTTEVTLPDGVSFVGSSVVPTSIVNNPSGTITIQWINIKDLAPNEIDYNIELTLKADENFRSTGLAVPFDIPISSIDVRATVDTLPRGNDDPGNIKITKDVSENFIPLRYDLLKSAPGKMPKGAGFISPILSPRWPYPYTLTVMNNSREPSVVTLVDNLPNGVRYLGGLSVTGPDAGSLSSPTIITPSGPGSQDFVTLDWGSVTLSSNAVNIITFNAAIWDNYTVNGIENSGVRIPHRTPLENIATLNGLSGPVEGHVKTNAMDATINKSINKSITDVGEINTYTLTYRINQYDDVGSFVITDIIGDGQRYNIGSASIVPNSVTVNLDGTTILIWNLGIRTTGTTGTITFRTTVNPNYSTTNPVAAGDTLLNDVDIDGTNQTTSTPTPDRSSASTSIKKPNIKKEILNYYYKDGTLKAINVAAPKDLVEFRITYSSNGIQASQRNIEIDEYAPSNMGPLSASLPVVYSSTFPGTFSPFTVTPNGLRWSLGTIPGNSTWIATFKVPVKDIEFVGSRNNLAKLAGENTLGFAYSDRDQVAVNFGKPNIKFRKTVNGPNKNAIKIGETYTYSITVSNPQNARGTVVDAFEMDLTDVIPNDLIYNGNYSVTGTGSYTTPVFSGQNVSMTIKKLAPDESITLNFQVTVDSTIASGETFRNNAVLQRPYSQPDRSYQYKGSSFKARATLKAEGIKLTKLISPTFAKIGDVVSYIIQATVPLGTKAYDIELIDKFPNATQLFIVGSATVDGSFVTPSVASGVITFPEIDVVDATTKEVMITYAFNVRITGGTHVPPYIENQINRATIKWDFEEGKPAVPVITTATLQVRTPHLRGLKQQRNATTGGNFRTQRLNYEVGDVIEYLISITNDGAERAFDSVIVDVLDPLLSFNTGSISTTNGSANESGGTIIWSIPVLEVGETATLKFAVTTLAGIAAGGNILDTASYKYNTNNNGFGIEFGPDTTNTVRLRSPFVKIVKGSSLLEGEIGDDILYSITLTVPNGTIAYTPRVQDTLPTGQVYIGPSIRQEVPNPPVTVTPSSLSPITFDSVTIDATSGEKIIIYRFVARIIDATHNPPFTEIQTNESQVKWAIQPGGALVRTRESNIDITAKTPNATVRKEQKKALDPNYTIDNISALPDDEIHYRLTIHSNGATTAYNVKVKDVLNDFLDYDSMIVGPSPSISGNTLEWNIGNIHKVDTFILEFAVKVKSGIGAGAQIPDEVKVFYDSSHVNPKTYHTNSNKVIIDIPPVQFEKIADKVLAAMGDEITYTLRVIVPNGVNAYNVVIQDEIPFCQEYKPLSWMPGTPVVSPSLRAITYNEPISPLTGINEYTFKTIVMCNRVEVQRNKAQLFWNITPSGPQAPPISKFAEVTVKNPNVVVTKEQSKNPTGPFTKDLLKGVEADDSIYYKITLENKGQTPAYNIITTDVLDPNLIYRGPIGSYDGTISPDPPTGSPDGTITWSVPSLGPNSSTTLIFQVDIVSGFVAGTNVINQASTKFDTSITNPVTLGPVLSNQVGFEFIFPTILKTVDDDSRFLGDTVTYMVEIDILAGSIAYDAQVTDILPPGQSYIPNTLRKDGLEITPYSTSPFILEAPQTLGEGKIIYTFQAKIDYMLLMPQDKQNNEAVLTWKTDPLQPPKSINSTASVYVTDSNINISKAQRNFTTHGAVPFTKEPIQVAALDIIHYELTVENLSATNTIYNVNAKDILDDGFKFIGQVEPFPPGVITHTGEPSNGEITWRIESIPSSQKYSAIIAVKVLPGAGAQSSILNKASATFSAVKGVPIITYGPKVSNTVEAKLPSLEIEKSVSKDVLEIGEIITYTLDVIVPKGTTAYNVVVKDTLPPQQSYVGEATRNGVAVFPSVDGQEITFDTEDRIDTSITYTFKARVVKGNLSPPYTQIQTNHVHVNWNMDPLGTPATPGSASKEVTVKSSFFFIGKEQRNVTKETTFDTKELSVEVGDLLEFRLVAHNFGEASAYDVVITDVLSKFDKYIKVVSVSLGNVEFNQTNNTVIWTIDDLPPQAVEFMIFQIEILGGIPAGGTDSNIATALYNTNKTTPITFGPIKSNQVVHIYPNVRVKKTSDFTYTVVGDTITYTVNFTLPKGTIVYNGQFIDTLPIGQTYDNDATLNGNPIEPVEIEGQRITFPVVPYAEAKDGDLDFTYEFEAKITSANIVSTTFTEIQTNEALGKWFLTPTIPAQPVNALKDIYVTDSKIEIKKLQRNTSIESDFTSEPIRASKNNIVEYSLTIKNTGPRSVYNIIIQDNLALSLSFIKAISVSEGNLVHSGEPYDGVVLWTLPSLKSGDSATAIFSTKILNTERNTINYATGSFNITPTNPNKFLTNPSNITIIKPNNCTAVFTIGIHSRIYTEKIVDLVIPTHGYCPPKNKDQ
ncbi:isopeptide-forming domain-containing fimbrial protein [Crassaminicella profunda]|uniref:isopeptide-forming domain-containing fimbrial protein n=1 Tax=Crassaminicella profunda TaxID=1286698 RepID=UPI001CA60283|nr:isopeptide-forming domain-containing fimbrial protein [Crassaminicella profunda]QZY55916.1 DUF11 domain-containing protein [Crassaminicella profunda]